jgi:acyl carrier protein
MEKNEIIERTKKVIAGVLKHEVKWEDGLTAADIDGWDSLSHMIIISEVEDEFGIKFKLKELNKLDRLGSLIDLIQSKVL